MHLDMALLRKPLYGCGHHTTIGVWNIQKKQKNKGTQMIITMAIMHTDSFRLEKKNKIIIPLH